MDPETEYEEFNKNNSWSGIYETIKAKSSLFEYPALDARRPDFRSRNRYRDVSPYDHSRVHLQREGLDYINANIVEAPEADRSYILTQGPLPNTCGHFWLMVWEQNSRAVLMLNRTVERGRGPLEDTCGHFWLLVWEQRSKAVLMLTHIVESGWVKCHPYYPTDDDEDDPKEMEFEDVGLTVTFVEETNYRYFTVRTFRLTDMESGESKEVLQFHYTTWPDFKVPTLHAFLNYLNAVRQSGALSRDVGPPVIHCSAGIGRSGTFCLVDTCLVLIEKKGSMEDINVLDILLDMRRYRMGLIQTWEQLRFSYEAIIEGGKRILSATLDSGFSDSNDLVDSSEMDVSSSSLANHTAASGEPASHADNEDSDGDEPPPLPPRRRPPPPPSCPPPDDLDDNLTYEPSVSNPGDDLNPYSKVTQPNGDLDEFEQMKQLLRGLDTEDVKPEVREVTEAERKSGVELRRRKREERLKETKEQIERMRQRQAESEAWRGRRQTLLSPPLLVAGLGVATAAGLFFLYRYYFS